MRHREAKQRAGEPQLLEDEEHGNRERDVWHDHRADHEQLDKTAPGKPAAHQCERDSIVPMTVAQTAAISHGFDAEQCGVDPLRVRKYSAYQCSENPSGGKRRYDPDRTTSAR